MVRKSSARSFLERIGNLEKHFQDSGHVAMLHNNISLVKSLHEAVISFESDMNWILRELSLIFKELKQSAGGTVATSEHSFVGSDSTAGGCWCDCHRTRSQQGDPQTEINDDVQQPNAITPKAAGGDGDTGCAEDWLPPEGSDVTVADLVKKAAEEAVATTDYVYSEEYKMYYSVSTGYYYDPSTQLLYEPRSGKYYRYDADTGTYHLHAQVEPTPSKHKKGAAKRKERCKQRKKKASSADSDESREEGELQATSGEEEDEGTDDSDNSSSAVDEAGGGVDPEDPARDLPPCMRLVVKASEKLQGHRLLLVSYPGATVGSHSCNGLHLPDSGVAKEHADLRYCEEQKGYFLENLRAGSRTLINGIAVEPGQKSPVGHLDILEFGVVRLEVHIHSGSHTCGHCEPGLLPPVLPTTEASPAESSKSSEALRRQLLKKLKKKYGLQGAQYETRKSVKGGYRDRAAKRREEVGSSFPHELDAEPASLDRPLDQDNVGFRLLNKMGWKEGSGLGKHEQGPTEPVVPLQRNPRKGLGSKCPAKKDPKSQRLEKTLERYEALVNKNEGES